MATIGVLKESKSGETRVAVTPAAVTQLLKLGYDVVVEAGAGASSSFPDDSYAEVGASIASAAETLAAADVILSVNAPSKERLDALKPGATVSPRR